MVNAVITADIVHSTLLGKVAERKLVKTFEMVLSTTKYVFYRGDSLQVYIRKPEQALRLAFLLRTAAIRIEQPAGRFDVKVSIGIGPVQAPVKDLGVAKGQAFLLSGRAFDETIEGERRMVITSGHAVIDAGLDLLSSYADDIFSQLTSKQAAVIFELLLEQNQEVIAKRLKKRQPTISKLVKASRWYQLQHLLVKFDQFINFLPQ
ncbi:MAG TPA: hypothetical protein VK644_07655 [Chitinophagaceae bacterium]|nr:hypothetical protein [Chitinophagaceae bacterium]